MKEALIQTLHQFFTHPFYNGIAGRDKLSDKTERWVKLHYHTLKRPVQALADMCLYVAWIALHFVLMSSLG